MPNLPKWAEKYFSLKCSEGNAICTSPDEDVNGWDFFVELPGKEHTGPEETRPPIHTAYVQIKSTTDGKLKTAVKLSNMLKACRSRDPWFVVLVAADKQGNNAALYAVHVWTDLMRQSLAAIRKASMEGKPLNKVRLSINFPPEAKVNSNIVSWMQLTIDSAASDYSGEKARVSETLGYEDGCGVGNLVVEAESEEDLMLAFLGIGPGIEISQFTYTHSRFGLPDPEPKIDCSEGRIQISPNPTGECEIKVRGPITQPSIALEGSIYLLSLPGLPEAKRRVRLAAPPVDLVWSQSGIDIFLSLGRSEQHDLSHLQTYVRIHEWLRTGSVEIQAWSKGRHLFRSGTTASEFSHLPDLSLLSTILDTLIRLAEVRRARSIQLSLAELDAARNHLSFFAQVLDEGSLRVEFPAEKDVSSPKTALLYYATVNVGTRTFDCLVQRRVREDVIVGDVRRITSDRPTFVEVYLTENATEDQRKRIDIDYRTALQSLEDKEDPLGLSDIRSFMAAQHNDEAVGQEL